MDISVIHLYSKPLPTVNLPIHRGFSVKEEVTATSELRHRGPLIKPRHHEQVKATAGGSGAGEP